MKISLDIFLFIKRFFKNKIYKNQIKEVKMPFKRRGGRSRGHRGFGGRRRFGGAGHRRFGGNRFGRHRGFGGGRGTTYYGGNRGVIIPGNTTYSQHISRDDCCQYSSLRFDEGLANGKITR